MTNATWIRHGACNGCGHCCTMVARDAIVRTPRQVSRDLSFYLARGFQRVTVDGEPKYVLWAWLHAPCPEHQENHCRIYAVRPQTCQDFPQVPLDIVGTPCSYWFESGASRLGGAGSPYPAQEAQMLALEAAS